MKVRIKRFGSKGFSPTSGFAKGKVYEVLKEYPSGRNFRSFHLKLENDQFVYCLRKGCNHLGGGDWALMREKKGGEKKMPKKDKTGPPKGAKGPRDGRGGGKGLAPGKGSGSKTGGKKGKC